MNRINAFAIDRSLWFCDVYQLVLFRRNGKIDETTQVSVEEDKIRSARIRCPKCSWEPKSLSRWYCSDCLDPEFFLGGCGTSWNTFETRGKCPGCSHIWRWTSCLSCGEWSLHEDWYHATD
ncbi:MAG: hypothetical protein R2681_00960 [Pyrinomonadaceae bacterium]